MLALIARTREARRDFRNPPTASLSGDGGSGQADHLRCGGLSYTGWLRLRKASGRYTPTKFGSKELVYFDPVSGDKGHENAIVDLV